MKSEALASSQNKRSIKIVESSNAKKCSYVVLSKKPNYSITSAPSYLDYSSLLSSLVNLGRKASSITSAPFSLILIKLNRVGRRAIFITLVPIYWFLILKYIIGFFEIGLFMFCIGLSFVLSTLSKDWGLITWGLKE